MKYLPFFILVLISSTTFSATRLPIVTIGHPVLRAQAVELTPDEIRSEKIQTLIDDMVVTMKEAGGVGLAAPQVNQSLRLFVMKSWPGVPLTVVINPKIEYLREYGQKDSSEGCLSIPGKTLRVKRFKNIHISYLDRNGDYVSTELTGFGAIIAQHEYDHLNGVLIVDLVDELNSIMNFEEYVNAPLM